MGTWARLTALAAVGGTGLAVVSGAAGWDTAHRVLAAIALPPIAALVATAWISARRLLTPSTTAFVSFGLAALLTGRVDCGLRFPLVHRAGTLARLRHADEATHHVAPPAHGCSRVLRRRRPVLVA